MTVRYYSTTPASNNMAPPLGFPEGAAASTINDCARQMMAEVRETFEESPYFDWGDTPTRVDNDTFTFASDLTARYPVGNRVKLVGATTGTGRISASTFGAGVTTVDVVMDSGNVPTSLARVAVMPVSTFGATSFSSLTGSALAITPTWSAQHKFSLNGGGSGSAVYVAVSSGQAAYGWSNAAAAADEKIYDAVASSTQLLFRTVNDASNSAVNWLTVDRTGTTVDSVTFPRDSSIVGGSFRVGTTGGLASLGYIRSTSGNALVVANSQVAAVTTMVVHHEATSSDNSFISFVTEASLGTVRGSISYNRAGGLTAYNTTCRESLKKNIKSSSSAIDFIRAMPIVEFDWKDSDAHLPWFVTYEKTVPLAPWACQNDGVDVSKLGPATIKAVQELIDRVAALEAALAKK